MAKLKSLKYSKGEYANRTIILPLVGETDFDEKGQIEVKDELAEELISLTAEAFDFEIIGKPKELTPEEQDVKEYKELLDSLEEKELLEYVAENGDEKLKNKAASMQNEKIRTELLKLYKKEKFGK
jgi:hypothetical protein